MGSPKSWKTVEIEQQCRFGWTLENVAKFCEWSCIKDYAYILQDKDVKDNGEPKEPHIHCMLRFNDSVPTTAILARAQSICGRNDAVTESQLERMKNWNGAIAYLTHSNASEKHRYDDSEVISNFNWQKDRDKAISPIKDDRLLSIVKAIDEEKMRKYNYMDFVTAAEYVRYKSAINDAFAYVNDRNISKGAMKNMQVMFLTGESGTGKTTYAKSFCEEHKLSYFVSSGSNDVLDGYGGQDVLILDDLRPSCLGLSDLLKLLDNNTSSTIKSRYINKSIAYCRYIIVTTVLDIDTFFNGVFAEEKEPIVQLKRRCKTYMRFHEKSIDVFMYNQVKRDYDFVSTMPNVVASMFAQQEPTKEEAEALLADLFSGFSKAVDYSVHNEPTLTEYVQMSIEDTPFGNKED